MNAKYEFTGETKIVFGVTLKQIRALISFGVVAKGNVGGWIAEEKNLATAGDAWIYGDAQISGDADFFLLGPIGSRRDHLCIHADAKIGIRFTTGCFTGTEDEFKKAIEEAHGDNEHGKTYGAAISLGLMIVKSRKETETKEAA